MTLEVRTGGQLYVRSQLEDYTMRGNELESYSFFEFIIDTYEEAIPASEKQNNGQSNATTSSRGRPRNDRSHYKEGHSKNHTHRRVIRSKGHSTLPNIVGPFFPQPNDPTCRSLYCASMLALLFPWRDLQDIKAGFSSFEAAFVSFSEAASQTDRDVLASVQYYYDCKAAASIHRESDDEAPRVDTSNNLDALAADSVDSDGEDDEMHIELTEADLLAYEESQKNHREELHGLMAIAAARTTKLFGDEHCNWTCGTSGVGVAHGADYIRLQRWQNQMSEAIVTLNGDSALARCDSDTENAGDVAVISDEVLGSDIDRDYGVEQISTLQHKDEDHLSAINPSYLLKDQRRAYDIIDWHLTETLAGQAPPQLLMVIPGEGGVGKSKAIQTITDNFRSKGVGHILVKAAYTGIAASIIDGKTLHVIAQIPINGREQSQKTARKLAAFWKDKMYLIVDEKSMVSRTLFARLSAYIAKGKALAGESDTKKPFGGVNVIVSGDFHQFPPVAGSRNAPLFWPCDSSKDSAEELLGRKLYEEFNIVVRLKEQVRVTDPDWLDLLQHVRHGSCRAHHVKLLRSLIITNTSCPPTDFSTPPWNESVLITPRHAVRKHWNAIMAQTTCRRNGTQLFICAAYDTFQGRPLTLSERFAVATKKQRKHREKHDERAALANKLELAKGMKVMVTFNVETDLDVANGARGEIVEIVLDERETAFSPTAPIVELTYPPAYILVKMSRTKAVQLEGLEKDVLPLVPLERTFSIVHGKGLKTIRRRQLPVTPAYSFTDYRSQGQTLSHSIIDIATPPSGGLTPFNVYVALSRGRGRDNIRLLRDFDEKLLMSHPCEYLRVEDERLMRLDVETEKWWNQKTPKSGEELM